MGYEDEVLCGNVANCKRASPAPTNGGGAPVAARAEHAAPAELVDQVLPDVRAVQQAVRAYIDELRKGVWWA
jgi:hypothetical protein